jgi:threonine dehydrogenase-like Zn-dependent dehydrogenase
MRAVTWSGRHDVRVTTLADPGIVEPADAVVRVRLAGICGSDLHVWHERERGIDPGTVMGHELMGEIVAVGREVTTLAPGQRVLCPFTTSCGRCPACREGLTARCPRGQLFGWIERGRGLHGAQAELVRVPLADGTLVAIPEGIDDETALLLGDVITTGWYCARNAGVRPGSGATVVVGCGPVGLAAIAAARELGAERLFAVDSVPERLDLARRFGAEPLALAADPLAVVAEATEGRGAAHVLEAVGSPGAGRLAWQLVRPGGTLSVAGVHTAPAFPFTPAEAYDKNLKLAVGRCPARGLLDEVWPFVGRRGQDLRAIVSHRLALDDAPRGYEMFDRKLDRCTKVVLRP